uniref:Uncharacterized protein n=1 Tax=Anguilla anguilla TaxID=7936 RepID=A0A0E9TCJ3_ANGAN
MCQIEAPGELSVCPSTSSASISLRGAGHKWFFCRTESNTSPLKTDRKRPVYV